MMPAIFQDSNLPEFRKQLLSKPTTGFSKLILPTFSNSDQANKAASAVDASVDQKVDSDKTEAVLQQHLLRVQRTLMSAVDKQTKKINDKVKELKVINAAVCNDKQMMGVQLYGAKVQVGKLNSTLEQITVKLEESEHAEKLITIESESVHKELLLSQRDAKKLAIAFADLKAKLQEAEQKIIQLTDINTASNSDFKIQARIHAKERREFEASENSKNDLCIQFDSERKNNKVLLDEKKSTEKLLHDQKLETIRSQKAADRMHQELIAAQELKRTMKKKWEDSLGAMEKRDGTLQAVQEMQSSLSNKLIDRENELRICRLERDDSRKKIKNFDNENGNLITINASLRAQILSTEQSSKETPHGTSHPQNAESLYKQDLEKLGIHHELAKEELHRKNLVVSDLTNNLERLRKEYELKTRIELIEKSPYKDKNIEELANQRIQAATQEHTRENHFLRHENAEVKLKISNTMTKLDSSDKAYMILKSKYDDVHGHYGKLYEEAKHLIYALEKKEHDLNYLKSVMNESGENDKTKTLKLAQLRLKKDLIAANLANERLQNMWLESQKENLKCKEKIQAFNDEQCSLITRLGVSDMIKENTRLQIDQASIDGIDNKLEATKVALELRKLQPILSELQQKNIDLERQLIEAKFNLEEKAMNNQTCAHMLKTEIRRLYVERQSVVKARLLDDRSNTVVERKYIIIREAFDKLKLERINSQKHNFELKCRAEDMEKRYNDLKDQYQHFAEVAEKNMSLNQEKKASKAVWSSFQPTVGLAKNSNNAISRYSSIKTLGGNEAAAPEGLEEIPDFDAWRLKLSSLSTERDFLRDENNLVKDKLQQLVESIHRLERNANESNNKLRLTDTNSKSYQLQIESVSIRCLRAEKLAASIEHQLKSLRPNTKIDYKLTADIEPSTQLIAALLAQESIPNESVLEKSSKKLLVVPMLKKSASQLCK